MSAVISAFPPQSTGGGAFVLNCIYKQQTSDTTTFTYDLSYGGLICFARYGQNFSINCGNLYLGPNSVAPFTTHEWSPVQVYHIPLPSGTLSVNIYNNSNSFIIYVYGYELMET